MRVNNIDVIRRFDHNLPFPLADEHRLQQIFLNIIINAEQAMLESQGKGRLTVRTRWNTRRLRVEIAFQDNGPGIPWQNLSKIFDPFFTTKPMGKGTGLGLSISYGIIQEHGGHIRALSDTDGGSTFTVELPVKEMKPQQTVRIH
jgi:two-component system NtrC family sensor kinase